MGHHLLKLISAAYIGHDQHRLASSPPTLVAFRLDFYLLIAVASVAALLALNLPGPIACQLPSDRNE